MCEEESDDPEAVHKLLEINDSIHRTIERYKLVKKGDLDAASRIPKGTLGTTTGVSTNANNELSLIDFDPEPQPASNGNEATPSQGGSSLENDLLGLSLGEQGPTQGGGIALGSSKLDARCSWVIVLTLVDNSASISASSTPPAPQQQASAAFKPNYDILASLNSSRPASQSPTPVMGAPPQAQPTATPPPADPFASLVSASPRASSSPFQPPQSRPAPSASSLLDLAGPPAPAPQAQAAPAEDDEWDFASSLPASNTLPSTNKIQVLNSQLRVDFAARRVPNQPRQIHVVAIFSNNTTQPIGDLHFQVAVEKVSNSLFWYVSWFPGGFADTCTSLIHCNFGPNLAETLHRSNRTVFSKRCLWMVSMQERGAR